MEREHRQLETLMPVTRLLLDWVEETTGRHVAIEADQSIRSRGRALFVASDKDPSRHLVKYDPLYESTVDALIAHECGHIAMIAAAGMQALVPVVTELSRRRALHQLEPELSDLARRGLPVDVIAEIFPTWLSGTVSQLVDTPADISIESWLRHEWPALHEVQERSLRDQARTYALTLDERVRRLTPPAIWRSSVRMNGRLVQTVANLLNDQRLVAPWKRQGLHEPGGSSGGLMPLASAHAMTSAWEKELGIGNWFEWKLLSELRGETVVIE